MRAVAVLAAAVFVVLAGGGLVLVETSASPPPATVLSRAQRFVRGEASFTYSATESVSSPAGTSEPGALLVRQRAVRGSAGAGGVDFSVVAGRLSLEYRMPAGGLWARGSGQAPSVLAAGWVRAGSFASFERYLQQLSGVASPAAADVAQAVLLDELSSGSAVRSLVLNARGPRRHATSVRTLDVMFDPVAVLGPGAGVDAVSGQIVVDANDHPRRVTAHLRAGAVSVDAAYDIVWGGLVTISPPAASEVVASV